MLHWLARCRIEVFELWKVADPRYNFRPGTTEHTERDRLQREFRRGGGRVCLRHKVFELLLPDARGSILAFLSTSKSRIELRG